MIALTFLNPGRLWFLLVVALLGAAYVAMQFTRRKHVVAFTNVELLDRLAPKRPGWRRHVVAGLLLATGVFGVLAVARPINRTLQPTESGGKILLVFDVSLSMEATDVDPNRLDAAKKAAKDFVDQVDPNIQVGLESFSGNVSVRVAPTLDHQQVVDRIDALELGEGTAIGDALAVATDVIGPPSENHPDDPSGVIVLLSDGETTVGRPTSEGAQIAADAKIPVYSIAFGTPDGTVLNPQTGQQDPVPVNTDELSAVAATTGGSFYEAPTADALEQAYSEISGHLNAGTGEPIELVTEQTWKYVAVAMLLLAAGWILSLWWLRGIL
jgi:Ca-activated chloride channel family protein